MSDTRAQEHPLRANAPSGSVGKHEVNASLGLFVGCFAAAAFIASAFAAAHTHGDEAAITVAAVTAVIAIGSGMMATASYVVSECAKLRR